MNYENGNKERSAKPELYHIHPVRPCVYGTVDSLVNSAISFTSNSFLQDLFEVGHTDSGNLIG